MKKTRNIFFASLCALLFLNTACSKWFETSKNGHLDGYWHLDAVDTLSTGGTLDLAEQRVFWSVQGTVFSLYAPDVAGQRYVSQFSYSGDTFKILDLRIDDRTKGDPKVEDISKVQHFGVNKTDESFTIENLKHNKMTLRSESLRLHFTKM